MVRDNVFIVKSFINCFVGPKNHIRIDNNDGDKKDSQQNIKFVKCYNTFFLRYNDDMKGGKENKL